MKRFSGQRQRKREIAQLRERNAQLQARVAALEAGNARWLAQWAAARKHSGNSSQPPSRDSVKLAPTTGGSSRRRKMGGQPGHARHQRPCFPPDQVDERKIYGREECSHGGSDDWEVLPEPAQVVQRVELLPKPFRVTEQVVQACQCRNCQRIQTGPLPAAIAATGLIGPRMMGLLRFRKGAMRNSYTAMEEFLGQTGAAQKEDHRLGRGHDWPEPHRLVREGTVPGSLQHGGAIPQARASLFHLHHDAGNRPDEPHGGTSSAVCRDGSAGHSRNTRSQGTGVLRAHLDCSGDLPDESTIDFRLPLRGGDGLVQGSSSTLTPPSKLFLRRLPAQIRPRSHSRA